MKKRLLSLLLVICMVIGMLPVIAMASGGTAMLDVNQPGNSWLTPVLEEVGDAYYYVNAETPDQYGMKHVVEDGASKDHYNFAFVYEENGPTIYLRGAEMENNYPIYFYGDATTLNIVVEENSSLYCVGTTYATITSNAAVTITTIGDATLTLRGEKNALDVVPELGGLKAYAATTTSPKQADFVEYAAADATTYKSVLIGANVTPPEDEPEGEEGGEVEPGILEDFLFEYWNGSTWGATWVEPGDKTVYFDQTDAGNGYSYLTETGADADNYVLKIEYPADEAVTVYFNGLNMVQPGGYGILFESATNSADVNLVIEKGSSYTVDAEGYYGGIECYTSKTFTISSAIIDEETGELAKLTVHGEDTSADGLSGAASIWHRGNMIIDGAVLEVTADKGYAIGAAGTITIIDSDVVAWAADESLEGRTAFNSAPIFDAEQLGAIASTTHVPTGDDLVKYVEDDAATYKYVHIGPGVKLPGSEFGTGEAWDVPVLNAGETKYYLNTIYGDLTEEGASADWYHVALIYDENGATIRLKGANLKNPSPIDYNGTAPLTIVVEADSTLEATGTGYAINGTAGGEFTITSVGDAVLTLKAAAPADFGGQRGGIATFNGNLTLLNANVNVEFDSATTAAPSGIFVNGADLIVDGSVLNIGKGHAADTMNSPIQVVTGNLLIQNGSDVKVLSEVNARPCRVDGTVTISDSDVEFAGEYGDSRVIWPEGKPTAVTLNYTVPYIAKASTATPAVDPVAFTATIDEADLVDYADADVTTYYYVKITVEKQAEFGDGEAWFVPELNAGEEKYYLETEIGDLTEEGATAENYDVKLVYDENGATIYLNGVNLKNPSPINYSGSAPLKIVVEADSSLYACGNDYPAIVAPVDTIITSEGDAVLTVTADGPNEQFMSIYKGNQTDGAIRVAGNLTLENANLNVEFPEGCAPHSGIVVDAGNLIVDGGNLNVGKGYTANIVSLLQVVGNANDDNVIEIKNGANVVLMTDANNRPIRYDGPFTISDSNFEAGSTCVTGDRRIFRGALPTINGNVTIVGSTKAPTLDTVNFAMTAPADTAEIDPATLVDTYYYYVKITVKEEEPEVPVVPAYKFGNTVTCNETLDLNFYLPKDAVPLAHTWIVTYGDKVLSEGEYSLALQSDGRYRVRVSYYPHQLNSVVTVICKDANGVVLAERSNSIQGYCMLYLAQPTATALDSALMVAMLEYGSLAQLGVAKGNAAVAGPLANRELTATHRAYLTGYAWKESGVPTVFAENNTSLPYTFSSSVTCNETLDLNFYLNAAATAKAESWTVTINGVEVSEDKYTVTLGTDNRYRVRVPFLANQMNSLVSVTCKDAEGNVIAQRSNSIREYAMLYLAQPTATALDSALMVAMLEFGTLAQIGLNLDAIRANYLLNDTYRAKLTQYVWPN